MVNDNTNFKRQTKRRTIACIERNAEKVHFKVIFTMDRLTNLFKPKAEFEISNIFFKYLLGILKCIMFFILNCSMQRLMCNKFFGESPKVNIIRYMKIEFGISRNMKIWGRRKIHSNAFVCNKESSFTNFEHFNFWLFYNNKKIYKLLYSAENPECYNLYNFFSDFKFLILVWAQYNSTFSNKLITKILDTSQKIFLVNYFKNLAILLTKKAFIFTFGKNNKKCEFKYLINKEKIVEQAIYFLLEIVFEPKFSDNCQYLRGYRNYDTTLKLIKNTFQKANWFVEGYIQSLSWNLKTKILLEYLEVFIKDRAFLKLIWTYLKFANDQNVKYVNIFTKSSFQRPNLSIMLNNIYLNQFDIWLNNLSLIVLDQKNFKCFNYEFAKLLQIKKNLKKNIYLPIFFFKTLNNFYYVRFNDKVLLGIKNLDFDFTRLQTNNAKNYQAELILKKFKLTQNLKNSILWLNHLISFRQIKKTNFKAKLNRSKLKSRWLIINAPIWHILIKLRIQNLIKLNTLCVRNANFIQLPLFAIIKYFKLVEKKILQFYRIANNYYYLNKKIHHILKTVCAFSIMSKMNYTSLKKTYQKYGKNLIIKNKAGIILIGYL